MKKLSIIILALTLLLTLGQCKKNNIIDGKWVHITVKVNDDGKHDVNPEAGFYSFTDGDIIYVGNDGKYVGYLVYGSGAFSGNISAASSTSDYLHLYFLGGKGPATNTLTAGTTPSLTADISDQSNKSKLPVIACGPTKELFSAGNTTYKCFLYNRCALVKFNTNVASSTVTLSNMFNQANVNFATNTVTPDATTGSISFATDANGEGWAVLLPHEGGVTATASAAGYGPASVTIPTINNNDYVSWGITVNLYNPLATPLTFVATTDGVNVGLDQTGPNLQYSKNGGDWTDYSAAITLNTNETVAFRGNNTDFGQKRFTCSDLCYIYGNVTSLLHAEDYATNYELAENAFAHLFESNTNIDIHPEKDLVLPATTLAAGCYMGMFQGCTSLANVPNLPATALQPKCYYNMFNGCTSLINLPSNLLPATTLAAAQLEGSDLRGCYESMFRNCSGLTSVPNLPATTLTERCYANMFRGAGMTTVPNNMLSAVTMAPHCCESMLRECPNLTNAPEIFATTLAEYCCNAMCYHSYNVASAGPLHATQLVTYCYYNMYNSCRYLKSVTCYATNTSAAYCTDIWLHDAGTSATGSKTFITPSTTYWSTGTGGIPEGWTRVDL